MESLEALLDVPLDSRDEAWEDRFLTRLCDAKLNLLAEDPQNGPDGWPYLMAETSVDAQEPAQKVIEWLASRGIGLVVNPQKDYPDFVLSYGMLWFFRSTGKFILRDQQAPVGQTEFNIRDIKTSGPATESYLPLAVRKIIKEFFQDQGVFSPKYAVISFDNKNYELALSLESLGNPPENEHPGIAEALSWFLPGHYRILLTKAADIKGFSDFA
jgi:hypothetical protein